MNETSQEIRLGVVGLGVMGMRRAQIGATIPSVEIVGVADPDKQRRDKAAEIFKCKPYENLESLLDGSDLDVVILSVPNNLHANLASVALGRKKHVLIEKPMAITVDECKRMVEAGRANRVFLKVGSNHRFFPNVIKAHELIGEGFLGDPVVFRGWIGHDGSKFGASWFRNHSIAGGGALIDNGCHILDIARWFIGEPYDCVATCSNLLSEDVLPAEDYAVALYTTENRKIINVNASWIEWYGYFYFEVYGSKGFIIADSRYGNKLIAGKKGEAGVLTYDYTNLPQQSYKLEMEYFFSCITKDEQPEPAGYDGQRVVQMIRAAYESSLQKKHVLLA